MAKKVKIEEPIETGFKWGFRHTITVVITVSVLALVSIFIYAANVIPSEIKATERVACQGMQNDVQSLAPDAPTADVIRTYIAAAAAHTKEVDTRSELSLHMQLLAGLDPVQAATANTQDSFTYDDSIAQVRKMCLIALGN
jgi:hypothetical protein